MPKPYTCKFEINVICCEMNIGTSYPLSLIKEKEFNKSHHADLPQNDILHKFHRDLIEVIVPKRVVKISQKKLYHLEVLAVRESRINRLDRD